MTALPLRQPPETLCILRTSALGDVTHVLPLIRTLQTHWPQTRLTWIIGKFEHKLVGDIPDVEFIIVAKRFGLASQRALAKALAGRSFDVLLNLQVAFRSNLLSMAIKAKIRLGYDRGRAKELHGLFINHRIPEISGQHVLDCFFSFLETLGLKQRELRWEVPVTDADQAFAAQHLPSDRPNLIISPCSSHALRNWQVMRYAAVADYASQRYGMRVVLTGGRSADELAMGEAIEKAMSEPCVNLIGKDTIKQLMAMIARADLLITPDSGPAHMGSAAGTPTIGLHAASNPARSGPYRWLDHCVDRYDDAARKYRGKSAAQLKWGTKLEYEGVMDLITVEDVIAKIDAWAAHRSISRQ